MSSFKIKIILAAPVGVRKDNLVNRVIKNRFAANYKLTVGVDILTKDVEFRRGEIVTLSIWVIGGQQRFEFIRSTFYKGSAGAILVFDLTRPETFQQVKEWIKEIRKVSGENIPFILIGNKANLIKDDKTIYRNEARLFAEKQGSIYIETSSGPFENLDDALQELTRIIIDLRASN